MRRIARTSGVLVGTAILCVLSLSILDIDRRRLRTRTRAVNADAAESLDRLGRQFTELNESTSRSD